MASGDPLADRVILWTRVTVQSPRAVVAVRYEVAIDPELRRVVQRGTVRTDASKDHTVKVDVAGLRAGTTYYYRFHAENESSPVGRTRRCRSVRAAVRFAVVVLQPAAGFPPPPARALPTWMPCCPRRFSSRGRSSARAGSRPATEWSAAAPRPPRASARADLRPCIASPFSALGRHEITNDAWRGGAQNHTEGVEGSWTARVSAGLQAYYEWMPIRQPDPGDPRRSQRGFSFGDLVDLSMLEERLQARSVQLPAAIPVPGLGNGFVQTGAFLDPSRTLLGDEQEAWLASRCAVEAAGS